MQEQLLDDGYSGSAWRPDFTCGNFEVATIQPYRLPSVSLTGTVGSPSPRVRVTNSDQKHWR